MQRFTIRDIENLTGIKAHTWRIWEQRYPFFSAKRKDSQHRYYDNEDLKILLQISYLYHSGWKISKIAGLTREQIRLEVQKSPAGTDPYVPYILQLIGAAVDFDEEAFISILNEVIRIWGFEQCITQVCYPFLMKVGLLWSTHNIIPAQEHFSSYIIQNRIIVETEKIQTSGLPPEIILICPQGEFHELPLLFIQYLLRKNGWSTVYLGVNIHIKEVVQLTARSPANCLYVHLITNFTGSTADEFMEELCRAIPGHKIYISGEGCGQIQRSFVNLKVLKSDQEIYSLINRRPN